MKIPAPTYIDTGDWAHPDKMVARLKAEAEAHPQAIVRATLGPWHVCFTGHAPQLGAMFSAKVTRSTNVRDWQILGRMAALIGAPNGMMPDTIEKDATATHYWIWGNDPEVQPLVDKMMGRAS